MTSAGDHNQQQAMSTFTQVSGGETGDAAGRGPARNHSPQAVTSYRLAGRLPACLVEVVIDQRGVRLAGAQRLRVRQTLGRHRRGL
jgi:hypothetical protein